MNERLSQTLSRMAVLEAQVFGVYNYSFAGAGYNRVTYVLF